MPDVVVAVTDAEDLLTYEELSKLQGFLIAKNTLEEMGVLNVSPTAIETLVQLMGM